MAEKRIKNEFEYDYRLIGIATTLKEYRLGYFLNELFSCDFRKLKDLLFESSERERNVFFGVLKAIPDDGATEYLVFSNKNGTDTLLPEAANFDYIVQITGKLPDSELADIIREIKKINQVLLCTEIPLSRLKNQQRLIYEEEKIAQRPLFRKRHGNIKE